VDLLHAAAFGKLGLIQQEGGMKHLMPIAVMILGLAAPAEARRAVANYPAIGMERTATTGSAIFQRENVWQVEGVKLLGDAPAAGLSAGDGLTYYLRNRRKLVACPPVEQGSMPCLIDRAPENQMFTEQAGSLGIDKAPLAQPVRYETGHSVDTPGDKGTFRQQLSFLGVAGNTLRLSYREFVNDMARPAFTDEVTFTLSGSYPETIAYKDIVIDVLGISNAGIRYIVRSTQLTYIEPPGAPVR
jgi:hypothetical protein